MWRRTERRHRHARRALLLPVLALGCARPEVTTLDLGRDVRCYTAVARASDVQPSSSGREVLVATAGGLLRYTPDGRLVRRLTRCDGLVGHTLREVLVVSEDELWMATAQGVSRLRGGELGSYTTREGLNDDRCYALALDAAGALLVGTHRGVSRFDGRSFHPFNDTHEFSRQPTRDIHAGPEGAIWFAKEEALTHYRGDGGFRVFQRDPLARGPRSDIVDNSVLRVVTDPGGRPWVGTSRGLGSFDETRWARELRATRHAPTAGLRHNRIAALARGPDGTLWVGHGDAGDDGRPLGLGRRDGQGWRYLGVEDGLPSDGVHGLRVDGSGVLWIATSDGAARYQDGRFTAYRTRDDLPSNHVVAIAAIDGDGVAVLTRGGLRAFRRGHEIEPPGLPADELARRLAPPAASAPEPPAGGPGAPEGERGFVARASARDASGGMWIGTRRSGLWRYAGGEWQRVLLHGNPFPREITSLCFESEDVLWVGTAAEGALRIELPAGSAS